MANYEQILTNNKKTTRVRDERIDSVKYWLIVLVVTGHIFLEKPFYGLSSCTTAWKWVYIFHMPLFIFISGYFSRKKDKKDLWSSIWKLLEPLLLFQTISIITRLIFKGSISIGSIFTPWYMLWYLLSLIYWRLIIQLIPDKILLNNTTMVIIGSFCISIISGFLPFGLFLSIQRTFAFMPFFFLGYCMKEKNIFLPKKYKPLCYIFLILTITIPLFFPNYLGNVMHYEPYENVCGAIKRIIVFVLAIPMSIAFINICPNTSWVARQGKLTMQYYIYHALIIPPFMIIIGKINLPISLYIAFIYTIVITIGISILSRLHYFTKFTNPSSFIKKMRVGD